MTTTSNTTVRAVTIDTKGQAQTVALDAANELLDALQHAVGGYVDVVTLTKNVDMWVDEEGLLKNLPVNIVATHIARLFGRTHQVYLGPAVFTGGMDDQGTTLGLTEDNAEILMNLALLASLGCLP